MKIFIPIPTFTPHGGTRVIIEIANRLTRWHEVHLYPMQGDAGKDYWNFSPELKFAETRDMRGMDCLLITSPHSIYFQQAIDRPKRIFVHLQMLEHMFHNHGSWHRYCYETYASPYPMFSISDWNIKELRTRFRRTGPIHYIGNGVNTTDFPITRKVKEGKTVLVEGWVGYNPCKDTKLIAPQAAERLRADGYTIIAYSQLPITGVYSEVPHEYHVKPSLKELNTLYERATILLKASQYDARACAPVEAMTKGTVTARAITLGDDDLIHRENCLKVGYSQEQLYAAAKELLTDNPLRTRLAENCYQTIEQNSWDHWIGKINDVISV